MRAQPLTVPAKLAPSVDFPLPWARNTKTIARAVQRDLRSQKRGKGIACPVCRVKNPPVQRAPTVIIAIPVLLATPQRPPGARFAVVGSIRAIVGPPYASSAFLAEAKTLQGSATVTNACQACIARPPNFTVQTARKEDISPALGRRPV